MEWNLFDRDNDLRGMREVLEPGKDILHTMNLLVCTSNDSSEEITQLTEWLGIFCRACFLKDTGQRKICFLIVEDSIALEDVLLLEKDIW